MTRERILLILGAVTLVGVLLVAALWLSSRASAEPEPTPSPSVTIDTGAVPDPDPTPSASREPSLPDGHTEDDGHDHEHGPVEDCATGPVACDDEGGSDPLVRNTAEDVAALAAVRPKVVPFVLAWGRVQTSETADARAARLAGAGASAGVATQVSVLARANTTQTGLTADTTPQQPQRVLSVGREDGLLKFQVALNVDAKYEQPDGSGSFRVIAGTIDVYLSDAGTIEKIVETFPAINEMR